MVLCTLQYAHLHLSSGCGLTAFQISIDRCRIIVYPLDCDGTRANQRLQRLKERRPNEDTNVSRLGSSTSEDNGVLCTGLAELVVRRLQASQIGKKGLKRCQDTTDSADCSIDRWEVLKKDGQESVEGCLSFDRLQFSITEFVSRDRRCEGEAQEGEQGPEVELHVEMSLERSARRSDLENSACTSAELRRKKRGRAHRGKIVTITDYQSR